MYMAFMYNAHDMTCTKLPIISPKPMNNPASPIYERLNIPVCPDKMQVQQQQQQQQQTVSTDRVNNKVMSLTYNSSIHSTPKIQLVTYLKVGESQLPHNTFHFHTEGWEISSLAKIFPLDQKLFKVHIVILGPNK